MINELAEAADECAWEATCSALAAGIAARLIVGYSPVRAATCAVSGLRPGGYETRGTQPRDTGRRGMRARPRSTGQALLAEIDARGPGTVVELARRLGRTTARGLGYSIWALRTRGLVTVTDGVIARPPSREEVTK